MLRREKKKKKEILSDKIANLLTVGPSADVEDDHVFGTKPKTVTREDLDSDGDSVEEAALSNFRKQNASLLADLSGRYAGEVTTRRELGLQDSDKDSIEIDSDDLAGDSDDDKDASGNEEGSVEDEEDPEKNCEIESENLEEEEEADSEDEDEGSHEEDEESDEEGSQDGFDLSDVNKSKDSNDFKHFKDKDASEEVEKGRCVKNQLSMWENLLEMRINLQKCLITANKLPLPNSFQDLKKEGGKEFDAVLNKSKSSVTSLMTRLMELQGILISKYPETKDLFNKNKIEEIKTEDPMDEEISSDSDSVGSEKVVEDKPKPNRKRKMADYSDELADRFVTYTKYRNSVIQKWNDKTRVATIQKNQPAPTSILSQIQFILGDSNKLLKRTQLRRTKYEILGEKKTQEDSEIVENDDTLPVDKDRRNMDEEYCSEIFDDDDFYHQLLRELIEHKSADISDPIQLSRQWIMLQQMRSKMKRKIDTRATKGRRIRYAVHSKLVNFMASEANMDWTDEMKNELYASLFGKQFEGNTEGVKKEKSKNTSLEVVS